MQGLSNREARKRTSNDTLSNQVHLRDCLASDDPDLTALLDPKLCITRTPDPQTCNSSATAMR